MSVEVQLTQGKRTRRAECVDIFYIVDFVSWQLTDIKDLLLLAYFLH